MVEDANRGIGSRIRGAARGARDRVTGAADTITGIQFRRQFEEFTDAVARTVVGIHHDQSELRDGLVSLEENQGKLEAAQTTLSAEQEKLRQEFERFRDPRMLILVLSQPRNDRWRSGTRDGDGLMMDQRHFEEPPIPVMTEY